MFVKGQPATAQTYKGVLLRKSPKTHTLQVEWAPLPKDEAYYASHRYLKLSRLKGHNLILLKEGSPP